MHHYDYHRNLKVRQLVGNQSTSLCLNLFLVQPLRAASKSKDCCYNPDSPGHDRPGPGTVLKKFLGPRSGISQNGCGCPCNSLACVRSPPPHETPRTLNRRERLGVCFLNKILPVPEAGGNRLISTVVGWSWGTSYPGRLKIRCTRAVILLLFRSSGWAS